MKPKSALVRKLIPGAKELKLSSVRLSRMDFVGIPKELPLFSGKEKNDVDKVGG